MKPRFEELAVNCVHRGGLWNSPDDPHRLCHLEDSEEDETRCFEANCPIWKKWTKEQSDAEARLEKAEGLLMRVWNGRFFGTSAELMNNLEAYLKSVGKIADNAGGGE